MQKICAIPYHKNQHLFWPKPLILYCEASFIDTIKKRVGKTMSCESRKSSWPTIREKRPEVNREEARRETILDCRLICAKIFDNSLVATHPIKLIQSPKTQQDRAAWRQERGFTMKKIVNRYICLCVSLLMLVTMVRLGNISLLAETPDSEFSFSFESEEQDVSATPLNVNFTDEFLASASGHLFEGVSEDSFHQILQEGGQIYRHLRVQSDYYGTRTYRVPVPVEQVEYLISVYDSHIQPPANPFPHQRIMYSQRPHSESIVIVLLSDGFTAAQFGTWPNPASGTVLYHANNAMNSMIDTHPFGLFEDLFTVYVIHTYGNHPATGFGYLGTITSNGATVSGTAGTTRETRIGELADSIVSPADQAMIQVISNAAEGTGWGWVGWHYLLHVHIGVTSLRNAAFPPGGSNTVWPSSIAWQCTFIHEFGHAFGRLWDEHGGWNGFDELSANTTFEPNTNI